MVTRSILYKTCNHNQPETSHDLWVRSASIREKKEGKMGGGGGGPIGIGTKLGVKVAEPL